MALKALLFGSLDTLADTHDAQRRAFNEAFDAAGLDWHWEPGVYDRLIDRAGNASRVQEYARQVGHTLSDEERDTVQRERILRYGRLLGDLDVQLRPGVDRLVNVALGEGRKIALVSNAEREMVDAFQEHFGDRLPMNEFAYVGDITAGAPKPDPEPYRVALHAMALGTDEAVAIEDTGYGLRSALAADLTAIAVPTDFTREQDFSGAAALVDSLGTIQEPARSLRVPVPMEDDIVTLDYLQGLIVLAEAA